jgi:hypothetical protein
VDSPDELCMVVSVQNITCPVADLEDRTGSAAEGIRQGCPANFAENSAT